MTSQIWTLTEGCASEAEILAHLVRCDARFMPPLSIRVDLSEYAHRLHGRARCFEAWTHNALVGLLAVYLNDRDGTAFISNVSVDADFLGRGIATELLAQAIKHAATMGLVRVRLYVSAANTSARHLYENNGFCICATDGERLLMQLDLPEMMR